MEVLVSISDCQDLISRVPIKKYFYLLAYLPGMFLTTCFALRIKFLLFTGARASERTFKASDVQSCLTSILVQSRQI